MPDDFVLYGGTALALRRGHRESLDFDFFSSRSLDPGALLKAVPFLTGAAVIQQAPNTLSVRVDGVNVAFFGGLPLPVLDHPALVASNSVVIASLLDLAGTKAKALLDRIERKDYQDILELLDAGLSMSQIAGAAEAIFPAQVSSIMVLRALSHYDDGAARALPDTWKERLSQEAARVRQTPTLRVQYPSISLSSAAARR